MYSVCAHGVHTHGMCAYGVHTHGMCAHGVHTHGMCAHGVCAHGVCAHIHVGFYSSVWCIWQVLISQTTSTMGSLRSCGRCSVKSKEG